MILCGGHTRFALVRHYTPAYFDGVMAVLDPLGSYVSHCIDNNNRMNLFSFLYKMGKIRQLFSAGAQSTCLFAF
ncbi:MAG: hypothetical protein MUE54_05990 [Anaerolineae bacterium]|nr:hypothetical protein [Anaerolineae bacterium]